jgi:Mce-associated membrane protein
MAPPPGRRRPVRVAGQRRLASRPSVRTEQPTAEVVTPQPDLEAVKPAAPTQAPPVEEGRDPGLRRAGTVQRPWQLPAEIAAGVIALLLAVLLVLQVLEQADRKPIKQARLDASAAARSAVVALISVNYQSLAAGKAKAEKTLAPKFRPEYDKFLTSLQSTATQNKLVSSASVESSGVLSASADHVKVLLFVDQISTNASRSAPRIDQPRVTMKMVKLEGKWLVEGFEVV